MADNLSNNPETGRLEQAQLRMPEVTFYFSGDRDVSGDFLHSYLGDQELELLSLQRFCDTGEGISYYILLDISASISGPEFAELKEAMVSLIQSLSAQDRITVLTFGDEVQTVFSGKGGADFDGESILALDNSDQHTLLFEAVNQMAVLAKAETAKEEIRQVTFVITDGEDMAKGKTTMEEARHILTQSGVPVYGFTVQSAPESAVNSFGEFSRDSGGYLTILSDAHMKEQMIAVSRDLGSYWRAVFQADSNKVSNGMVNLSLEFSDTKEKRQIQRLQEHWIADTQAPEITEIHIKGDRQIELLFSEAVTGAEAAGNYSLRLQESEENTEILVPAVASIGADSKSAVLTFAKDIENGTYELEVSGITDDSMEQNAMSEQKSIVWTKVSPTDRDAKTQPGVFSGGILIGAGAFLLLMSVVVWLKIKRKKQCPDHGSDRSNNASNESFVQADRSPNRHVKIEKQQLEEKKVWFLIRGQKDELELTIQKSMIVGRSAGCELSFEDPSMSRQQFVLELHKGQILLRNLSQSSETLINGAKVGENGMQLSSGDWIGAGQLQIRIRF